MNGSCICFAAAVVLVCSAIRAQDDGGHYSTCPDLQHAVVRSVVYNEVPEPDLPKWAKAKPHPRASTLSQVLHVRVQIEGERVFCAQALDGPADKQRAAVKSAMGWRFKSDRGDFNGNVIGTLTFRF
jgi:hypothetical protein